MKRSILLAIPLLLIVAVILLVLLLRLQSGNVTENKQGVTEKVEPTKRYGLSEEDFERLKEDLERIREGRPTTERTERVPSGDVEIQRDFEITVELPLDP
ncbi:MAG: hypothetical protein KY475_02740 [Planctomycetes bacterium]|nr:hypothetical protein [Planctomycetota bacterium]